jgi:RNA polymerase sigma-70 factor (ECF subfamily)
MAAAGNDAAFDELVKRHRSRLCRVARRLLGSRDAADDVAQEALVRAYLTLPALRDPERFGAWVVGIAENLCRMHLRTVREVTALGGLLDGAPMPARSTGEADLPALIAGLPAGTSAAADLYFMQGKEMRAIGEELGISLSAVKSRIRDARRGLRTEDETMKSKPTSDTFDAELQRRLELARWYREFATLASSGISLLQAFDTLAAGPYRNSVVQATKKLRSAVQAGSSMSDALQSLPTLRTPETMTAIRAGEFGGILDRVAAMLADWIDVGCAQRQIELSFWLRTLGEMIDSNVPLDFALSWGVQFPAYPGLKDTLVRLAAAASEGLPLTPTVSEATDVLPAEVRVAVAAGESAGCLGFAFRWAGNSLAASVCGLLLREERSREDPRCASFGAEVRRLLPSGTADTRRAAVETLGSLRDSSAIGDLVRCLGDPDEEVRIAALRALAKMDARSHAADVAACLADPEPKVRRTAISALGDLQAHEHARELCSMIGDPDLPTATLAVQVAERTGEVDELVKAAIHFLGAEPSAAWSFAADVLNAHPVPEAVPGLLKALDYERHTAIIAACALARLGRREGVPVLRIALAKHFGSFVWSAAEALESLKDADSADAIRGAVKRGYLGEEWLARADRLASRR